MDPKHDYQDGYMDGRYAQEYEPERSVDYDQGYIQGSSDYLDIIEHTNGVR